MKLKKITSLFTIALLLITNTGNSFANDKYFSQIDKVVNQFDEYISSSSMSNTAKRNKISQVINNIGAKKDTILIKLDSELNKCIENYNFSKTESMMNSCESSCATSSLEGVFSDDYSSCYDDCIETIRYREASNSSKCIAITNQKELVSSLLSYMSNKMGNIYEDYKETPEEIVNMFAKELTSKEIQDTEDEIINFQTIMTDKLNSELKDIIGDFKKMTNYEEKGNIDMDVNINSDELGFLQAKLKLKDYIAKASGLDTSIEGEINGLIEAAKMGDEEDFKTEFSGFLDYIGKDNNIYLLLDKFNINLEGGNNDIKEIVDMIKKIASQGKYVMLGDEQNKAMMQAVSKFSPNNIIATLEDMKKTPLFTPYKKEGKNYYLVPTREACDMAFELNNSFMDVSSISNPYYAGMKQTCTNDIYNELLRQFTSGTIKMYITTYSKEPTFAVSTQEDGTKVNSLVKYEKSGDKNITEISVNISPDQTDYPGEGANLEYVRGEKLDIDFNAEKGNYYLKLNSNLDSDNNATSAYFNFYIKEDDNYLLKSEIVMDESPSKMINLDDNPYIANETRQINGVKLISGYLNMNTTSYDYTTGDSKISGNIVGEISGKTMPGNDTISEINLDMEGVDLETNSRYFDFEYGYKNLTGNNEYDIYLNYDKTGAKASLDIETTTDKDYHISSGKIKGGVDINFFVSNTLDFDYSIDSNTLNGDISFETNGQEIMSANSKGTYKKDYKDITTNIIIKDSTIQTPLTRDAQRVTDLEMINTALKKYMNNQDTSRYPDSLDDIVSSGYLYYMPEDPLGAVDINNCKFGYMYHTKGGGESYKLSTCFETNNYKDMKAKNDGGRESSRYELGDVSERDFDEENYISRYTSWQIQEAETDTDDTNTYINIGVMIDKQVKNTIGLEVNGDIKKGETEIGNFSIDANTNRTYKEIDIEAPTNYIKLEEVIK